MRVTKEQLEDICIDCTEQIKAVFVKCNDCPVNKLKRLTRDFFKIKVDDTLPENTVVIKGANGSQVICKNVGKDE